MPKEVKYTLFEPGNYLVNMIQEYPELRDISTISQCTDREIRFAWYYASPSSPYFDLSENEKARKSASNVFDKKRNAIEYNQFSTGKFPAHVVPIIKFFSNNNLNARVRSKILAEKVFTDIETLIGQFNSNDNEADGNTYVQSAGRALDLLPKLIEILEGSDGVKKKIVNVKSESNADGEDVNIEDV